MRIAQNLLHISQILNFNRKHGDMPIYINFRKVLNSKNIKKRIHFLTFKETIFFDL